MVGSLEEIVGSLKEFIILCDKKRGNNITFSVKDEFNSLTKDEQILIISSINAVDNNLYKFASLPERIQGLVLRNYEPGYSEDIRKSKYNNLPISNRITILTELMGLQDQDSFYDSKEEPFELSISAAQSQMIENLKITLSGIADIDEAQTIVGFPGKFNEPAEGEVTTFIDVYAGVNVTVNNINGT